MGDHVHFCEKFEYTNNSLFKRTRQDESNKTKISAIGRFIEKFMKS